MAIKMTDGKAAWLTTPRKFELPSDRHFEDGVRPDVTAVGIDLQIGDDVRVLVLRDGDTVRVMSDAALELRGELPAAALAAS